MKKLSETYKELGIAFTFPIEINDSNGNVLYHEASNDYWAKWERDDNGDVLYYEDSTGVKRGTPRSAKTCEGKVVEVQTQSTMKPENLIYWAADIAEAIVEHRMGAHIVWEDREDGSEGFTEEAQDLFCEVSDIIEPIILKHIK